MKNIRKIKYLSPDGQTTLPNLPFYTKGLWLNSVRDNENNFTNHKIENVQIFNNDTHKFFKSYLGGIIVFYVDTNQIQLCKNNICKSNLFKDGKIGRFSIGNFFKGKYIDLKTGKTFNEKSISVELLGIPSDVLVAIATDICKEFKQQSVIVKDFNKNAFYMVDDK